MNLFDMSQNFNRGEPDWLMQRYLTQMSQSEGNGSAGQQGGGGLPNTPATSYVHHNSASVPRKPSAQTRESSLHGPHIPTTPQHKQVPPMTS